MLNGMEMLFVSACVVAGVVTLHRVLRHSFRPRHSRWQGLAKDSGLKKIRTVEPGSHALRGAVGPLDVLIEESPAGRNAHGTRIVVGGLCRLVGVKAEGVGTRIDKALGTKDLETGDAAFDRDLYVEGSPRLVGALLDAETRQVMRDVFAGRIVADGSARDVGMRVIVGDGRLTAHLSDGVDAGGEPQPATLRALLDVARRLKEPADVLSRLVANVGREPLAPVRRRLLLMLSHEAPDDPRTRAALQAASRSDPDAEVRLLAALFLGGDGRPTLAELAGDPAVHDSISAQAIDGLGEHLSLESALLILKECLPARRSLTAAAAARALGAMQSEAAEGPLLSALAGDDDQVRSAAAEALGRVGTTQSVLPLREVEEFSRGSLRKSAREAIAQIQARLTDAGPGQLALTNGADGQVTLADDPSGRVTLPDSEKPR